MSLTFCIRSSFVIGFLIKQFASNSGNTCFLASSYTFITQYMILCDLGVPVYLDCSQVLMVLSVCSLFLRSLKSDYVYMKNIQHRYNLCSVNCTTIFVATIDRKKNHIFFLYFLFLNSTTACDPSNS